MTPLIRTAGAAALATPALLLLLAAAAAQQDDPPHGVRILYPADGAIAAGPTRVIVAVEKGVPAPAATLDGRPLSLHRMGFADTWAIPGRLKATAARVGDRSACALLVADLKLPSGRHQLAVGGQKVDLLVTTDPKAAAPAGRPVVVAHRLLPVEGGKLDCTGCHEQIGVKLGAVDTPKVCAPCHSETSVQLVHGHVPQPLNKCAMCHDPHGASRPKLLVDSKEKLCAKCHGSGHFRG